MVTNVCFVAVLSLALLSASLALPVADPEASLNALSESGSPLRGSLHKRAAAKRLAMDQFLNQRTMSRLQNLFKGNGVPIAFLADVPSSLLDDLNM